MSRFLCTFSGKYGDILWSLPTAKYISENIVNCKVDFAVMPYYVSLLPLLAEQSYIDRAFVVEDWLRTHSNHGDQPWRPPQWVEERGCWLIEENLRGIGVTQKYGPYEKYWHLTYKGHPGISAPSMPLIDFIAYQQGISFQNWPVVPFLDVYNSTAMEQEAAKVHLTTGRLTEVMKEGRLVTYSFNEQYAEMKKAFFEVLWRAGNEAGFEFFDVSTLGWKEALWVIKNGLVHVGCRSACWVLANGVGQTVISFEPHPSRHSSGHLGKVFGNPYGREIPLPIGMPPAVAADAATSLLRKIREEKAIKV